MRTAVIDIHGQKLNYFIQDSSRARRTRIAVDASGNVVVTKPKQLTVEMIESFIRQKHQWIQDKKEAYSRTAEMQPDLARTDRYHFHLHRAECAAQMRSRVEQWNKISNYAVTGIYVKQMSSRWGSCTPSNVLNFNYKLLFLPEDIQDYVVVHELCHIREKNHSKKFWNLVESVMPNYQDIRTKIKELS